MSEFDLAVELFRQELEAQGYAVTTSEVADDQVRLEAIADDETFVWMAVWTEDGATFFGYSE